MKKREFFKRLLGITAAAVVAPKVLLAEEEPINKVTHNIIPTKQPVSATDFIDERFPTSTGARVREVVSCDMSTASVISDFSFLRVGDIVNVWRGGKIVGLFSMVTSISSMGMGSFSIRISSAKRGGLDIKEGDILCVMATYYQENNPTIKK